MRHFSPLRPKKADWQQSMGYSQYQRLVNFETMTAVLIIAVGNIDLMQFLICFHQQIMPQNTNIELQCKRKAGGRGKHKHLSNTNLRRERECEKK